MRTIDMPSFLPLCLATRIRWLLSCSFQRSLRQSLICLNCQRSLKLKNNLSVCREAKQHCNPKSLGDSIAGIGKLKSVKCNCNGSKVSILCDKVIQNVFRHCHFKTFHWQSEWLRLVRLFSILSLWMKSMVWLFKWNLFMVHITHGTIYFVLTFECGWNPMVWPFEWNLFSNAFKWCCLLFGILKNEIYKFPSIIFDFSHFWDKAEKW